MACKPGSVHIKRCWMTIHLERLSPTVSSDLPERQDETSPLSCDSAFLSGLAPDGVYPAAAVTRGAVRSYRTVSPLPLKNGGLFSVALSLRLPSPGVTWHRGSMEPGLSSTEIAVIQPSDLSPKCLEITVVSRNP